MLAEDRAWKAVVSFCETVLVKKEAAERDRERANPARRRQRPTGLLDELRSTRKLILKVPGHILLFFFNGSFTVQAIKIWNALPLDIREAQSIGTFKKLVKDHFLSLSAEHL
ncbi:jg15666 [Pararge aegeria aegeria]|uniref:Jg15666 protein n=1 Tax=Pararge aegeria aegeria TaxID=348720 RepID=A0A8S4RVL9_9NEOP|nr:jg15666 [Pararge aegeria aegeria]